MRVLRFRHHFCERTLSLPRHFPRPLLLHHCTFWQSRSMATVKDSIPHIIRTADDPRQNGIWSARLSRIEQINSRIRLLRLSLPKEGVRPG